MTIPARVKRSAGRHALVDGIPFQLPVDSSDTAALMAAFTIDADRAAGMLPGNELHSVRLPGGRSLLVITIVDYKATDIGKSVADLGLSEEWLQGTGSIGPEATA